MSINLFVLDSHTIRSSLEVAVSMLMAVIDCFGLMIAGMLTRISNLWTCSSWKSEYLMEIYIFCRNLFILILTIIQIDIISSIVDHIYWIFYLLKENCYFVYIYNIYIQDDIKIHQR
mgnify:FL=1